MAAGTSDHLGGQEICIWSIGVKGLAGPEQNNHIVFADVFDGVRKSRRDVHDLEVMAGNFIADNGIRDDVAESDERITMEHEELLRLRIVIVITSGNARFRS